MQLQLKQIFDMIGQEDAFHFTLDLSSYELYGLTPFIKPILVTGKVFNRAGIVELHYQIQSEMMLQCDRCLQDFIRPIMINVKQTVVTSLNPESEEEYIVVENGTLDLAELVTSDILLDLPTKALCEPTCKGLCSGCGVNLNLENCKCGKPEIDPRFQILSQLLK